MLSRGNEVTKRAGVLLAVLGAVGCSADKEFALVSVLSAGGQFNDVAQLRVDVRNDPYTDSLAYPQMRMDQVMFRFDETAPLTFSIGYRTSHHGSLVVGVTPLDKTGAPLGFGQGTAAIAGDQVTAVRVLVTRGTVPPVQPDAGAPGADGGPDGAMSCDPNMPASCNGGTCFLDCAPQSGTFVPMCTMAGPAKQGELCTKNEDCEPGTQCLKFACANGTAVSTCLRFCNDNSQCASGSCSTPIPCGSAQTGYTACAQACDPVGEAKSGCANGLNCFVFEHETPDCDCIDAKRTKSDGMACSTNDECLPGLICVSMIGSAQACHPLCRLSAPGTCAAGTTCTQLVKPVYQTFGACL
jgi:hypothetical protein